MQISMTADQIAAAMQHQGLLGLNLQNNGMNGDFLAMLMQMLDGSENGEMQLPVLADAQTEQKTLTPEQQQSVLELFADLLMQQTPPTEYSGEMQTVTGEQQLQTAKAETQPAAGELQAAQTVQQTETQNKAAGVQSEPTVLKAEVLPQQDAQDKQTEALRFSGMLKQAVQKSRQPQQEMDFVQGEELQQPVKLQEAIPVQTAQTAEKQPVPLDVRHMVQTMTKRIPEALEKGDSTFTMKLKPEGLGEITVKLTQEAGKTAVTILSALPETEKLIGAQLTVLQKELQPMDVTVRQEPFTQAAQLQSELADRQQEFLFRNPQRQQHSKNWHRPTAEVEEILMAQGTPAAVLDAYI